MIKNNVNVVALDLPGHGYSSKASGKYDMKCNTDAIYQLMKNLELQDVVIVGHSMGGQIALQCYQDQDFKQFNINGVIAICPSGIKLKNQKSDSQVTQSASQLQETDSKAKNNAIQQSNAEILRQQAHQRFYELTGRFMKPHIWKDMVQKMSQIITSDQYKYFQRNKQKADFPWENQQMLFKNVAVLKNFYYIFAVNDNYIEKDEIVGYLKKIDVDDERIIMRDGIHELPQDDAEWVGETIIKLISKMQRK